MVPITHLHASSLLQMRAGESVIDYLSQVEDTKGNNGHRGMLLLCYQVTLSLPTQVNCL